MSIRKFQGKTPQIGEDVYIDPTAVVIGEVSLGNGVSFWPMAVARGDVHAIRVGAGTNVQDGAVLHVTHASEFSPEGHELVVGENVTVGHRAVLHGCTVGDYCLIGIGAIVMDGAVIENEVILGAGGLVPPGRVLESGHLYVGSPAKRIRPLTDHEKAFLRYSSQHYLLLKDQHRFASA